MYTTMQGRAQAVAAALNTCEFFKADAEISVKFRWNIRIVRGVFCTFGYAGAGSRQQFGLQRTYSCNGAFM